jgi:hypothetical protein
MATITIRDDDVTRQDVVRGYNNETIQAMLEADRIAHDDTIKSYTDLNELFKELDD